MFKNRQSVLPLLGACRHSGAGSRARLLPVALTNVVEYVKCSGSWANLTPRERKV